MLATRRLQNARLSSMPCDAEERVHRARWAAPPRPRDALQVRHRKSRARRKRSRVCAITGSPCCTAASAGALHEHRRARGVVLDQLAEIGDQAGGTTSQPRRQPVMSQDLRKGVRADQAVVRRRARSQEATARTPAPGRRSRGARRRRRRRSRCRAGGSARAAPSARSRVMVQPVGLFGELRYSARVPGVRRVEQALEVEPPARSREIAARPSSRGRRGSSGSPARFGQSGTTSTTRSPGPTRSCDASISAFTPGAGHGDLRAGRPAGAAR